MSRDVIKGHPAIYDQFHFSAGVRHGDLVVFSGVIGTGSNGRVPDDPTEEFKLAWAGVGRALEQAGLGFDDVLEYTTFHVGLQEHMGTFGKVRDEVLSEPWPAWTAIGITELAVPGARVEIRVIAKKS